MFDVHPNKLIPRIAEELKKDSNIHPPRWAEFVKTGAHAERPPVDPDWWFVRCASVLRTLKTRGPIGVSKLRVKYGGKRNRGMKPEEFRKASGNIIRKVLQQLEKGGYAKSVEKSQKKGRIITPKGVALLDKTAAKILKNG